MQIIVLGMHRSGTSLVTGLLKLLGTYAGPEKGLIPPDTKGNPKGYWERRDVIETNDWLLASVGERWDRVAHFNIQDIPDHVLKDLPERVKPILAELNAHRPWVLKDPRICLLFPLWSQLLDSPVCVLVVRHPVQIAKSLSTRAGFPLSFGVALWEKYMVSALHATRGLPRIAVSYESLMKRPIEETKRLYDALVACDASGVRMPDPNQIESLIDASLYREGNDQQLEEELLTGSHHKLLQLLRAQNIDIADNQSSQISQASIDILTCYENLNEMYPQTAYRAPLQADLQESENECSQLQARVSDLQIKVSQLELQLERRDADVRTVIRYFDELYANIQKTFDSVTWKVGFTVAESARKLHLCPRTTLVQDQIAHLQRSFSNWKNASLRNHHSQANLAIHSGTFISHSTEYRSLSAPLPEEIERIISGWHKKPLISIIMPVFNVKRRWLQAAMESVIHQTYPNWELCIADDHSTRGETINYLRTVTDARIKTSFLPENLGIAGASNAALKLATGEFIAFLDHDDELTADALFEVAKVINQNNPDLIYSDECVITMQDDLVAQHYKPDFSPTMVLSQNYICHLGVYRKSIIDKIGGFRQGFDGAQDYDLLLRFIDHTDRVHHIPKILYRWRQIPGSTSASMDNKPYAWEAGKNTLQDTVNRRGIKAFVDLGRFPGTYRVRHRLLSRPLVSIIIPFRDKPELLKQCIDSILGKTTYENFEIIGVSNGSKKNETFCLIENYQRLDERIRFVDYNIPFNFAKINNYAVSLAKGQHLILLNNDVIIISPDWIESLLEHSQRPEVGAVGAKLYYPDETVQHAGIIIGIGGVAGHSHKGVSRDSGGYFARPWILQNVSAVTGACLMVKKELYELMTGLDEENLPIAFNDVDFCLRLIEHGYLNVFTPYCELYHFESKSRGPDDTRKKYKRFEKEIDYMKRRHARILESGDPYYNPNLTLDREDFSVAATLKT